MIIKSLKLNIRTGEGDLEAEKNSIIAKAKQNLDSIQMVGDNLYECILKSIKFFLYFETGRGSGENAIILKPIIFDQVELDADEVNLASYIATLLKFIEDYEIYSLNSVDPDSVELPE